MSRPEFQQAFQELLAEWIPLEKLVQCISEGLDATREKQFCGIDGRVETVALPDYRVRLLYAILALKLRGIDKPPEPTQEPVEVRFSWMDEYGYLMDAPDLMEVWTKPAAVFAPPTDR
jgi:hypothetical protein